MKPTLSTPTVTESWARIEKWLEAHAPATFAELAPPARPSEIGAAEDAIGLSFPDPLTESLLRHDGTNHTELLPPFWELHGAGQIVSAWRLRCGIDGGGDPDDEDTDPEAEFGPWWHHQWIPFAADGCGDYLVLDQRPTRRRGRIGDADHEQGCHFDRFPMWDSLPALFDATATALETGELVGRYEPFVNEGGELEWEIL